MRRHSLFLIALAALLFPVTSTVAQGVDPNRLRLANLEQDLQALRSEVGRLRLEVEQLSRENSQLRQTVAAQAAGAKVEYVTLAQLQRAMEDVRAAALAADDRQRAATIEDVNRQLERLAAQTQAALEALAKSIEGAPQAATTITFSDDYPKEGIAYTVKQGDTLTGIAKDHDSTVRDIVNANRLTNPNNLRAGQTLFIPQR